MKVNPETYYTEDKFHRHEAVKRIVKWGTSLRAHTSHLGKYHVVHRIKCIVLKRYRKDGRDFVPLCKEWETKPDKMVEWILQHASHSQVRLIPGSKEFSPETVKVI